MGFDSIYLCFNKCTLPGTNIAPADRPSQKETRKYSNHPFSGAMLVSGRVSAKKNSKNDLAVGQLGLINPILRIFKGSFFLQAMS